MRSIFFVCLLSVSIFSKGQQRVLFGDSLESRAETNKIKISPIYPPGQHKLDFKTLKMGNRSLGNFKKDSQKEILSFSQERKKSPFLLSLVGGKLIGKDLQTNTEFNVTEQVSYDLMGSGGAEASINAIRESNNKKTSSTQFDNGSTISNIPVDTSYVKAEMRVGAEKKLCIVDLLFQNDGANCINGIAIYGSDTLFIITTDKKNGKYPALGIEIKKNNRVLAGMQLPSMHIGPSYTVVDKSLQTELRSLMYSILSLVFCCNESRLEDWR